MQLNKADRKRRERTVSDSREIRAEMNQSPQQAWGTQSGAMGNILRNSEAAQLESCSECGYGAGRHSRTCARAGV